MAVRSSWHVHLRTVRLHSLKRRKACMYETSNNECSSYKPGAISRLSFTQCLPAIGKIQIRSPLIRTASVLERTFKSESSAQWSPTLERFTMREPTPTVTAYAGQTDCPSLNKTAMPAARPVPVFRRSWDFFMSLLFSCLLHLLRNLALLQTECGQHSYDYSPVNDGISPDSSHQIRLTPSRIWGEKVRNWVTFYFQSQTL